jgi:transposase InsO family protein
VLGTSSIVFSKPRRRTACGSWTTSTWQRGRGAGYLAFAIDVFSRRIVGWKADTTMNTSLVLDTSEMALWARDNHGQPVGGGLVLHCDALRW